MKTRQQRLNEARAGRPPSPPQSLSYNQRGPKRTRAKPSATLAAGSVVPAAELAVQGEAQSLLYVWVDFGPDASSRLVNEPTHKLTIPSASIPALLAFAKTLRSQDKKSPGPAEGEHIPAMGPTGSDEGDESNQAEVQERPAERIIRSTSQAPDPTMKNKRKRGADEVGTPSPQVGSYGRGGRSPEEDEETEEQPGKLRRTRRQEGFTSRVAGECNTARQNFGLKALHATIEYEGGNVLTEYYEAARNMANSGKQSPAKAPIPIVDTTGRRKVPSPGHSDQSEKKIDEEVVTARLRAVTPSHHQRNRELRSGSPAHRQSKIPEEEEEILRPSEVAALRKLRDRVEKYKAALPGRRPRPGA